MPYYNSGGHGGGPSARYGKDGPPGDNANTSGGRSSSASSEPTYIMEHLATFTVTKETGIVYPADGMRRLLQLEKSNGIWSQKMQLRLERNWVLIMDNETGAVMERFPSTLIQEPTAFTSRDPMEMYNNILVFTVADDSGSGQRAEMHIFQCQSVSAQDLVEDLKMLQMGKLVPGGSPRGPRGQIPPPPALPPPEPPLNGVNVREQVSAFNASTIDGPNDMSREENNDEASSTSSEKYERDVTVLNHCFDDIEKFIARLQHAAAASRELERRRRNSKSKKRNLGDGMLTMRAKPPPEMEFIDIFQKFKLSFNLLAKLKAHIHDPNAPELVHFLFTPLALIVDASHDTNYDPNLPSKVLSPLLTREAVNLLIHCVTSKETELWHSLGDTWLVPRDQWKGHVPPYHPIFMDGWSPEYPIPEDHRDHDHLASLLNADKQKRDDIPEQPNDPYYGHREPEESHYSSDYLEYETREERGNEYFDRNYGPGSELYGREERERTDPTRAHSDISVDSIERGPRGAPGVDRAQEAWLDELLARHVKIVQVTYPRTANNDKELTVVRGEYLEILDDSRKWWKARNSRGQVAHVPHTIVTPHNTPHGGDNDVFNNPLYSSRYQRQGHGYNYEDSEIEGTSTSPGPEATHRPHAIPPPAPADWVRKERLGKKGSSRSSLSSLSSEVTREDVRSTSSSSSSVPTSPRSGRRISNASAECPSKEHDVPSSTSDSSKISIIAGSTSTGGSTGKSTVGSTGKHIGAISKSTCAINKCSGSSTGDSFGGPAGDSTGGSTGGSIGGSTGGSIGGSPGSSSGGSTGASNGGCTGKSNGRSGRRASVIPRPPPPPPPPPTLPILLATSPHSCFSSSNTNSTGTSKSARSLPETKGNTKDQMQEELKFVLTMFRDKKRSPDVIKSSELFVDQHSSPREVQNWLQSKGFSDRICRQFRGMTGADLFNLTKRQLELHCGLADGRRLDGQITLSRNASGYQTTRSSELKTILEKARRKVDFDVDEEVEED